MRETSVASRKTVETFLEFQLILCHPTKTCELVTTRGGSRKIRKQGPKCFGKSTTSLHMHMNILGVIAQYHSKDSLTLVSKKIRE